MLKIYQTNTLRVSEIAEFSVFADGGSYGRIPIRDTPDGIQINDEIEAFVYLDSADEVVATMTEPYAQLGDCAYLKVVSSGESGTFLDWNLPKDLLLPLSEQVGPLKEGDYCVVYIYQDKRQRPIASMKLHRHLDEDYGDLEVDEAVNLMIAAKTDLGYKAVINNEYLGLIYHEELTKPLKIGAKMKGWVSKIREDGKINVNINKLDDSTRSALEDTIMEQLKASGNRLDISDKTPPDVIYERFQVSKKNFKRAIGNLYKQRLITISPEFIELNPENERESQQN